MQWLSDVCRASAGLKADSLLIIFTLAALPPEGQHHMLSNAFKVVALSWLLPLLPCTHQAVSAEAYCALNAALAWLARSFSG